VERRDPDARDVVEQRIRDRLDSGDKKAAASALLEAYGREVLGFLIARLRDRDAASDVFSMFTEDVWKGLADFRWQCTARVWCYTLARHAASRYIKDARRRHGRQVPLSRAGPLSALEARIRTATVTAARTETRSKIARLRESLPPEDQTLILLRVSRKLGWREIAQIMAAGGERASDADLEKEAGRLRKRYQLAKDRLKRMATEQGLVRSEPSE
jgi:RNA polymerase sigma-70 factor, ECF subfamily